MRLSSRLPPSLARNALARAVEDQRARGTALIDLTESNPTRVGFDYPADLLAPLAGAAALEYEPQPLGLWPARAAVAAEFRRRGIVVSADRVALTSSTSEAYALLFKLFCDAGQCVLAPRPSYPLVEHLARFESVSVAPYGLDYHGVWRVDLDSVKRAPPGVRALLVVSPNNPTGSFLHRDDLAALAAMAAERGWAIIGDEVFADYPLDPAPHAASVLAQSDVLTCALGGLSKSAGLPQVKLGWIGFGGPAAAVDETLAAYEVVADTYLSVCTPVQIAAASLVERGAAVRDQIRARIAGNLAALRRLATAFPSVRVLTVEGGWSAVLRVPAVGSEESLTLELAEQDGVVVHPGYFFDFATEAFLVVSLLVEPRAFEAGAARVLARAARGAAS
jgi:hypothetical protein